MDIQLKKGLIEICVLKVLESGDSYGYKMVKDLSDVIDVSESTLYPILKRLETSESVYVYSMEHNSRLRKYYQITEKGKEQIKEYIKDWVEVTKVYECINGRINDE